LAGGRTADAFGDGEWAALNPDGLHQGLPEQRVSFHPDIARWSIYSARIARTRNFFIRPLSEPAKMPGPSPLRTLKKVTTVWQEMWPAVGSSVSRLTRQFRDGLTVRPPRNALNGIVSEAEEDRVVWTPGAAERARGCFCHGLRAPPAAGSVSASSSAKKPTTGVR
jgi:hypothetical protein